MNQDSIEEILTKSLMEKLMDMQKGLEGNIAMVYQNSFICENQCDMVEYARANGQIWGLTFAKAMLDAILRLEDKRILWELERKSDTKELAHRKGII